MSIDVQAIKNFREEIANFSEERLTTLKRKLQDEITRTKQRYIGEGMYKKINPIALRIDEINSALREKNRRSYGWGKHETPSNALAFFFEKNIFYI